MFTARSALLGLAAVLSLPVGVASPALAARDCPAASLCTYSGADHSGTRTVIPAGSIPSAGTDDEAPAVPPNARSAVNRTGFPVKYGQLEVVQCFAAPCYPVFQEAGQIPDGSDAVLPQLDGSAVFSRGY
ncbi:peptidase inhibitor family I36 protein [Streptomyces sp. NPDC058401]|uniref:peptidase inhibitor family I36 protein n=1 Tax=Streptomyces sp. NPDC058401 TaxID=3346480 RepID=UPI003655B36B